MWESDRLLPYACMFQLQSGHDRRRNSTLPQNRVFHLWYRNTARVGNLGARLGRRTRLACGLRFASPCFWDSL